MSYFDSDQREITTYNTLSLIIYQGKKKKRKKRKILCNQATVSSPNGRIFFRFLETTYDETRFVFIILDQKIKL